MVAYIVSIHGFGVVDHMTSNSVCSWQAPGGYHEGPRLHGGDDCQRGAGDSLHDTQQDQDAPHRGQG